MNDTADHLALMGIFVTVVDAGGLTGAARSLRMTDAAVAHAVAELERRVGAALLDPAAAGRGATRAGERYAQDCRRILAGIERAFADAAQVRPAAGQKHRGV